MELYNVKYQAYGNSALTLDYVFNAEGYIKYYSPTEHYPFYYIKDHLGNIRETYVYPEPNYKECVQRMQYYPSGLPWNETWNASEQPYKYNGKEFVEMHGLDEYDSEARWYYPAMMRTTTMDPLCEKYPDISPYAWCGNNFINIIDPEGMEIKLSNMTEEELEDYESTITNYKEISEHFNTLYSTLENSQDVYTVQYGQTITVQGEAEPVQGQFVPNKEGGGTITFKDKVSVIPAGTVVEEFFHAYQHENKFGYENGAFNREFEAKVAATLVGCELFGLVEYNGMAEFQQKIYNGVYGESLMLISPQRAVSNDFYQAYKSAANLYSQYNMRQNVGNYNYQVTTTVKPYSLINLIRKVYE